MNGGDILIISPGDEEPGFDEYLAARGPTNTVSTVVLSDDNIDAAQKAVNDKDGKLAELATNAEGDYLTGGDQYIYVQVLPGTAMLGAINKRLAEKNAVIGGNSAGMAVLGGYTFSAANDTVTSAEALSNPKNDKMTFRQGIFSLPAYMKPVITDTHLQPGTNRPAGDRDEDGRMGRSVAFLANLWDGGKPVTRAICAAASATLFVEGDGTGEVFGTNYVYFLALQDPAGTVNTSPLTFSTVKVVRVGATGQFNVATWETISAGGTVENYELAVEYGYLYALNARSGTY